MKAAIITQLFILACGLAYAADSAATFSGEKKLNNLASMLLEAAALPESPRSLAFTRSREGWVFIALTCRGKGTVRLVLDPQAEGGQVLLEDGEGGARLEAMRYVTQGPHTLRLESRA